MPKIEAPPGFKFEVVYSQLNKEHFQYQILLRDLNKKSKGWDSGSFPSFNIVGRVQLCSTMSPGQVVTHSSLDYDYHGKGLGKLMYAKAIEVAFKKKLRVRSSGYSSMYAERVWNGQGLRKYYRIRWRMNSEGKRTFYAYPKL